MPEPSRSPPAPLSTDLKAQDGRSSSGLGMLSTTVRMHALAFMRLIQAERADATKRALAVGDITRHGKCTSDIPPELSELQNVRLELEETQLENVKLRADQTKFVRLQDKFEEMKKTVGLLSEEFKLRMDQADSDALIAAQEMRRIEEEALRLRDELKLRSEEKVAVMEAAKAESKRLSEEILSLTESLGATRKDRDASAKDAAEERAKLLQEVQSLADSLRLRTGERDAAAEDARGSIAQLQEDVLSLTSSLQATREAATKAELAASDDKALLEKQVHNLANTLSITTESRDRAAREAQEEAAQLREELKAVAKSLSATVAKNEAEAEEAAKERTRLQKEVRILSESLRIASQEKVTAMDQAAAAAHALHAGRQYFHQQSWGLTASLRERTQERDAATYNLNFSGQYVQRLTTEMRFIREGLQRAYSSIGISLGSIEAADSGPKIGPAPFDSMRPATVEVICEKARVEAQHLKEVCEAVFSVSLSLHERKASLERAETSLSNEVPALRAEIATRRPSTGHSATVASETQKAGLGSASVAVAGEDRSELSSAAKQGNRTLTMSSPRASTSTMQDLEPKKIESENVAGRPLWEATSSSTDNPLVTSMPAPPMTAPIPIKLATSKTATEIPTRSSPGALASLPDSTQSTSLAAVRTLDISPAPVESIKSLQSSATAEDRLEQAIDLIQRSRYYKATKCDDETSQRSMADVKTRLNLLKKGWPEEHHSWLAETNRRDGELAVSLMQSFKRPAGRKDKPSKQELRDRQAHLKVLMDVHPAEVQGWIAEAKRRDAECSREDAPVGDPPSTVPPAQKRRSPSPTRSELGEIAVKKARVNAGLNASSAAGLRDS